MIVFMRLSNRLLLNLLLLNLLLLISLTACGARSFGGPSDDGGLPADGTVPPDGLVRIYDTCGYVTVAHAQDQDGPYGQESLRLYGAFYAEPWDFEGLHAGWPEPMLMETPDGVVCEVWYISGMDGPMPPDPPEELDGGEVRVWAGIDGEGTLEIAFNGHSYETDYRSADGASPWPSWISDSALALQVETTGSDVAAPLSRELLLPDMPEILLPPVSLDEPLTPDADGTHTIAWVPVDADRVEVHYSFNMDWDDAYFRCYLSSTYFTMKLPHEWLEQYSWGYGQMMVFAMNDRLAHEEDTLVSMRTVRIRRRSLNVLIWAD